VICFDGDQAGQKAALAGGKRALPLLKPNFSLQFIVLPPKEDPDSLLRSGRRSVLEQLLSQPIPLIHFLWEHLRSTISHQTPEQQSYFKKEIKDLCQLIAHPDISKNYQYQMNGLFFQLVRPGRSTNQTPVIRSRPTVLPALLIRSKILLALPLLYPEILWDIQEDLGMIQFPQEDLEKLSQLMISFLNDHQQVEKENLYAHIHHQGLSTAMQGVLDPGLRVHEPALAALCTPQEASLAWHNHATVWKQKSCKMDGQQELRHRIKVSLGLKI
jgi:DNA primase